MVLLAKPRHFLLVLLAWPSAPLPTVTAQDSFAVVQIYNATTIDRSRTRSSGEMPAVYTVNRTIGFITTIVKNLPTKYIASTN